MQTKKKRDITSSYSSGAWLRNLTISYQSEKERIWNRKTFYSSATLNFTYDIGKKKPSGSKRPSQGQRIGYLSAGRKLRPIKSFCEEDLLKILHCILTPVLRAPTRF